MVRKKVFKISSFENTDIELIKNAALTKKPIIIFGQSALLSKSAEYMFESLKNYLSKNIGNSGFNGL